MLFIAMPGVFIFYGPRIGIRTQLQVLTWLSKVKDLPEDNIGQNMYKEHWNTETLSRHIPLNKSLLEKNTTAES